MILAGPHTNKGLLEGSDLVLTVKTGFRGWEIHYVSERYKNKTVCVCVWLGLSQTLRVGFWLRSEVFWTECLMRVAVKVAPRLSLVAPNPLFSHTRKICCDVRVTLP